MARSLARTGAQLGVNEGDLWCFEGTRSEQNQWLVPRFAPSGRSGRKFKSSHSDQQSAWVSSGVAHLWIARLWRAFGAQIVLELEYRVQSARRFLQKVRRVLGV